jgi:hypothetical protein
LSHHAKAFNLASYQGALYRPQSKCVRITNDGLGAEHAHDADQGWANYESHEVYGARPLKGEAEFEVKITKLVGPVTGFSFGVVLVSKHEEKGSRHYFDEVSIHPTITSLGKQLYSTLGCEKWSTYGQIYGRDLRVGDHVGLILSEYGTLEFTLNGLSQGIAAINIYSLPENSNIYACVGLWNVAVEITKAGKTIECYIECYNYIEGIFSSVE